MAPKKTTVDGGATSSDGPTPGVGTIKHTYIPIFDNSPEGYKEWRSRMNLYRRKLDAQGKPKEAAINLLASLSGVSWKQVERNVETYIEDKDGFDKVLALPDRAFKNDDRVEMPRTLEKFFYIMGRRSDQTLIACYADHREALQQYGIKTPGNVVEWLPTVGISGRHMAMRLRRSMRRKTSRSLMSGTLSMADGEGRGSQLQQLCET